MARIGINIPNELMKRLEPLKPELNISQVCREALAAKAESHEQMIAELENEHIQSVVGAVWEQEREYWAVIEVNWEASGYEDAAAWVRAAKWEDWEHLHHRQDVIRNQERSSWDVPPPGLEGVKGFTERMGEFWSRVRREDDDFLNWFYEEHGGIDYAVAQREYMTAWLSYTNAVWELICQKREEHQQKWRSDREKARRNRPEPEVPGHILADIHRGR